MTARTATLLTGAYVTGALTVVAVWHAWRAVWSWAYWGRR